MSILLLSQSILLRKKFTFPKFEKGNREFRELNPQLVRGINCLVGCNVISFLGLSFAAVFGGLSEIPANFSPLRLCCICIRNV